MIHLERCPNGFRRVGDECVPIGKASKPKQKSFKKRTSSKASVKTNKPSEFIIADSLQTDPYAQLNRLGRLIESGWKAKPNIPPWIAKLPVIGYASEIAEKVIDVYFEVGRDIADGEYKDIDMYNNIERDRVDSLGFKPIFSPGGFVV